MELQIFSLTESEIILQTPGSVSASINNSPTHGICICTGNLFSKPRNLFRSREFNSPNIFSVCHYFRQHRGCLLKTGHRESSCDAGPESESQDGALGTWTTNHQESSETSAFSKSLGLHGRSRLCWGHWRLMVHFRVDADGRREVRDPMRLRVPLVPWLRKMC